MIDESVEHSWNTVPVCVIIDVDRQIAPLVEALNRIPHMRTYASCAGHLRSQYERRARVMIGHHATSLDPEPTRQYFERMKSFLDEKWPGIAQLDIFLTRADLYIPREHIEDLATSLDGVCFDPVRA